MGNEARILLIGTADTKADELLYLKSRIEKVGGTALIMDVGVLFWLLCSYYIDRKGEV